MQLRSSRSLTSKGQNLFDEVVNDFRSKLRIEHKFMDVIFKDIDENCDLLDECLITNYRNELLTNLNHKPNSPTTTQFSTKCTVSTTIDLTFIIHTRIITKTF